MGACKVLKPCLRTVVSGVRIFSGARGKPCKRKLAGFFVVYDQLTTNEFMDYLWTGFYLFTMAGHHHRRPLFSCSFAGFFHNRSNPSGSGCGPPSASTSASASLNFSSSCSSEKPYKRFYELPAQSVAHFLLS